VTWRRPTGLHSRAAHWHRAARGHHQPGPGVPGTSMSWSLGSSHPRALRQNPVEADHGRLKARLWPMRGLPPPVCANHRRRACARAEPAPWPLRAHHQHRRPPPAGRHHSARPGHVHVAASGFAAARRVSAPPAALLAVFGMGFALAALAPQWSQRPGVSR